MKVVVALGGNALGKTPEEQKELVKIPAEIIVDFALQGHTILVGHGNGPQVGLIFNAFKDAKEVNKQTPDIKFPEAGGMSQGYIGYDVLAALQTQLNHHKTLIEPVYFETLTYVDPNDPAFHNPTKPVGPFYKTEQECQANNPGLKVVEDSGRGYRAVVPSPKPINFIGMNALKEFVKTNNIIVCGGGGGIPVIKKQDGRIEGVAGVIDKDLTCSKLAHLIDAEVLIILTAVNKVYINFNKPDQKALDHVTVAELETYIKENQFAPGSMLPKIQAAIEFVKNGKNRKAIISNLEDAKAAFEFKSGTIITL